MSTKPFRVRLACGTVLIGVGAALATGFSAPLAAAEPDASDASGAPAGADDSPKKPSEGDPSTKPSDSKPPAKVGTETDPKSSDEPKDEPDDAAEPSPKDTETVDDADESDKTQVDRRPSKKRERPAPAVKVAPAEQQHATAPDPTTTAADAPEPDQATEPQPESAAPAPTPVEVLRPVRDDAIVTSPVSDPIPSDPVTPAEPTPTGLIADVIDALTSPFSSTEMPLAPASEPLSWTVLAAARRDFEQTLSDPAQTTGAPTEHLTSEVVEPGADAMQLSAALAPADQAHYTGQPSLVSQVVTLALRVVDVVLKPFGGILAFTSLDIPIFTDGVPPFFLRHGLNVTKSEFEGTTVWTLEPEEPTGEVIVALHGGAYVAEASLFHWWTYTDMARDTGATVVVPLYPLIPEGNAAEVVPETADLIAALITEHEAENVSVIGDSAGGGLALAAVQELVQRDSPVPSRLVLLAPWLDATVSDQRSAELDAGDPLLDVPNLQEDGQQWAGELGVEHRWASPINGSLEGLPPTTVISGSLDLLTPDSLRLLQRVQAESLTNFTFDFRNGQIHDWPIFAFLPDAIAMRPVIYQGLLGPETSPGTPAVENSLTYTPPPTIIDRLTVAGLRLVRDITGFLGIPYTAVLSQLITSEDPPFFLTLGLNARQTEFEVAPGDVWKVWEFEPPNPTGATVVAIHGGGAIFRPNVLHWIDYTQMARETGATVLVPLYPLATTEAGSLLNVTPGMADYLWHVIDERGAQNVSVYADSEGATYAFAAVRLLILRCDDVPASMVVMSGQADYSTENDGAGIDDPFFNQVTIDYFARFHTFDGIVDKDPRISPLRMETEVLQALPPTTMYVGTEEILLPANLLLYKRAVDIGAPISIVVGRGQFHDWPLAGLPTNSAAPLVRRDIYRQLGLLPDAVDAATNEVGVTAS